MDSAVSNQNKRLKQQIARNVQVINEQELARWIVSVWWGRMGDVHVRLHKDAPEWVRHQVTERLANGIVFPRSERIGHQAA